MTSILTLSPAKPVRTGGTRLHLLPECVLSQGGRELRLRPRAQRLLVLLATHRGRRLPRAMVAGTLWPDVTGARAYASLRSTLRELPRVPAVVVAEDDGLRLGRAVRVDWVAAERVARKVLARQGRFPARVAVPLLRHPLLPHWSEDWLADEQYAFAQLRVHALESLCRRLSDDGIHGTAIETGLLAVSCDPLRESAQEVLVRAHLAEGNRCLALEQVRRYELLLSAELGVPPGPRLLDLVGGTARLSGSRRA